MSYLFMAPQLKEKIQIKKAEETHNDDGGFDISYTTLTTIKASFKPLSLKPRYIRGVQIEGTPTHEFIVRRSSVDSLGKNFSSAFSSAFDSIADLNPLKSDYYIFVQRSSSVKGRLFRIHNIEDMEEKRFYLRIYGEEIEEVGSGYKV